jgi:phosphatidylethanolamine-binding protein (PEBP) family uncharacterized protein
MNATTTTAGATAATPVEGLGGFAMSSPSFSPGGTVPEEAASDAGNVSPALAWTGTPESAAELALVVTDESGGTIYWFVTGILTTDMTLPAGTVPEGGVEHASSAGPTGWYGPPFSDSAGAPLVFALYALNQPLIAQQGESSHALRERMIADSFATASIRGTLGGPSVGIAPTTTATG